MGWNNGVITTSYSTVTVTGSGLYVGGLMGVNSGSIVTSYSTGAVRGSRYIGGLVGKNHGSISTSFWDIETSGQPTSDGGIGKTRAEMRTVSTFLDAGWDFVGETENGTADIWDICEGTNHPRLVWQIPAGDYICPDGVTMADFSLFAARWLDENCDPGNDYCEGADLDLSGAVSFYDLEVFADKWLVGIAP